MIQALSAGPPRVQTFSNGTNLPRVAVLVVSYNTREHLSKCLASVHDQDYEGEISTVVVDNASFDRSVLFVTRHVTEALRKRGDFDARELL